MNFLIKLFSQRKVMPQPPIQPVLMPTTDMRLLDWRKVTTAVAAAKTISENGTFKTMLAILDNENPSHTVLALGVNPNDRLAHQGRIEGYEMCLNNLKSFCKPQQTIESIDATFENPDQKKK